MNTAAGSGIDMARKTIGELQVQIKHKDQRIEELRQEISSA
jgi:hypothetical protein